MTRVGNKSFENKKCLGWFLSFGGGLQSTTLLYMVDAGLLPKPLAVVHADTGDESLKTYAFIERVVMPMCERLNIPFLQMGRFSEGISGRIRRGIPSGTMPVFVKSDKGKRGMLTRQCTDRFKIFGTQNTMKLWMVEHGYARPEQGFVLSGVPSTDRLDREWVYGTDKHGKTRYAMPRITVSKDLFVRVAFGITTDESVRATERGLMWQQTWYPLIDMDMSRDDCAAWCKEHGYEVPPKSACVQCPYRSDWMWYLMWREHKQWVAAYMESTHWTYEQVLEQAIPIKTSCQIPATDFGKAIQIDRMLRDSEILARHPDYGMVRGTMYLHSSLQPLEEIDFEAVVRQQTSEQNLLLAAIKGEALTSCKSNGAFNCMS